MNATERLSQAVMDNGMIAVDYVSILPAGTVIMGAMTTPPNGFFNMHGNAYSRTVYRDLFNAIGTIYGAGDGQTTFNVPDARGLTIRGWDANRGIDTGRAFGSYQEDAIRNITAYLGAAGAVTWQNASGAFSLSGPTAIVPIGRQAENHPVHLNFDASRVVPTASENRMKNIALSFFIKYSG